MDSLKRLSRITGWIVFAIAFIVYFLTAERVGSLWDVGEFILGAYKLEVVHPPGAAIYVLIGRMFAWVGSMISDDPTYISFAVNLMSGFFTALMTMLVAKTTMMLGKLAMVGRSEDVEQSSVYALCGAGLVAGLTTAFCASIWFSAVEGEVYGMSTFFTALTFWAAVRWYYYPDSQQNDRWLVFIAFSAALSIGVHLLSILTFPSIALLYYFKKKENPNIIGAGISMLVGAIIIWFIQKMIIAGIPNMWKTFEIPMVNNMGAPFHTGLIPVAILYSALFYSLFQVAKNKPSRTLFFTVSTICMAIISFISVGIIPTLVLVPLMAFSLHKFRSVTAHQTVQILTMGALMLVIGFSTLGIIVIRANADTPVNMNVPSDAVRLLPYLNREQYGERPLLYGPHFDARPTGVEKEDRYGRVGNKYEIVEEKIEYSYDSNDKMFFPRVTHTDAARKRLYRTWWGQKTGAPTQGFNLSFLMRYQMSWMYWRYFMWNFAGRQNGDQGYSPWDKSAGHWVSGIKPLDESKLFNMDEMPDYMKRNKGHNTYYFLPLLFGLLGLFFHAKNRQKEFLVLTVLFVITGIGIIIYSNQPPNEPRERDYVLAGSFFTYCMWVGMGVLGLFQLFKNKLKLGGVPAAGLASILALSAPVIMAFQNFDDLGREDITASRDYASNFLESTAPNAIIFTYGDNDTYPLWYAQEVENIRRDVRVVNLSLIQVDWYINKLRNRVNDSAPLKLTVPAEAYRGKKRNTVFFYPPDGPFEPKNVLEELKYIGHPKNEQQGQTLMRSPELYIPVDRNQAIQSGWISPTDTVNYVNRIEFDLSRSLGAGYILKDELAIMDVIASNIYDRPVYFATTCKEEKLLGLGDYMQMEGLSLRIMPFKNKSDELLSIYGSGRVASDIIYDNVMNKYKWGGFDKKDLFVDNSYGAAIQSHRMFFMRASEDLLTRGQRQKAVDMCDKFFEAFPNMNFPYSPTIIPFISVYANAGQVDKAKTHLRILANNMSQEMNFFDSINPDVVESSFSTDYLYNVRTIPQLLRIASLLKDPAFEQEMNGLLEPYMVDQMRN